MELRHLRYFVAVAEAGSLTAAASRLHISQPPLSVAISKLESELGVQLLIRTPRGVEPTSAGRYLLGASSRVLGEIGDIVTALRRFGSGLAGSVTVAAVPVLMWRRIPDLVREHAAQAPEVEIRLIDPPPWSAIDMVQRRKADVAAIVVADHQRFIARHRGELEVTDWGEIPLVAALPPALDAPDPLPLRAFDGEVVLTPRRIAAVPSLPEAVMAAFARHHITPALLREVETIQAGLPLIEAGVARAILPDPDHASLGRFALTVRRLDPAPRPLRALALTRAGASADPRIRRLLACIAGHGRSEAPGRRDQSPASP